ncbi:MAG: phage portal protein [Methanobrevibacter sp.]|nr:phage portal protein [Methanobrevibacter sp.]
MVIIVTSETLQDDIIKSVLNEYEIKSQELSPEDFDYTGEILEPPYDLSKLKALRESSGLHDICIKTKCEDAIYSGKKIISKEGTDIPPALEEFLDNFLTDEECESFLNDLETYAFAGLEILRDEQLEFKGINHIPSLYLRMCEDKDKVVQKIGTHTIYFKVYDPKKKDNLNKLTGQWNEGITEETSANELLWFNSKSDQSKVYGEPDYLSEVDAILTDNAIVEYQLGHFRSKGVPNYVITITGNIEETEDYGAEEFEDDLKKEFSEITNEPGTALVLCIPSNENNVQVNVHKIGEEMKEGSFLELAESNADRIYRIHKVPRERLGQGKASGIASNRTEMLLKTYSKSTVGKLQKRMASYINNTIIKYEFETKDHKLQYLPANFDEEDALLDRGIKLLQNAAMTLGEFINRFGEQFELHMDETDEYFNARFMNNQALDTVLYGDDEANTEEQLQDMVNQLYNEMNPSE